MPPNLTHNNWHLTTCFRGPLSLLSLLHPSIYLLLLRLKPILLLMLPYCAVGAQKLGTSLTTVPILLSTWIQERFLEDLTADSICWTVHWSHAHLVDDVLGTEFTMHWHCSNLLSSLWPHPYQLLQDLWGICLLTSPPVFSVLCSLRPPLS